jgi:hypothetical protein
MFTQALTTRPLVRIGIVLVALALAAAAWIAQPDRAESVVPAGQRVGTLTFSGFSTQTVHLRSFSFEAKATPCDFGGGGGCAGKATLGRPVVTLDTSATSPQELATLLAGEHMQKLTVVLYKPYTSQRSQEFVFQDALFTLLQTETNGPNSAEPRETLSWDYRRITQRVYNPGTNTVLNETCWDIAQNAKC